MDKFMEIAIKQGMANKEGGPFGAVIVKDNKVVSKGHNSVIKTNDPTAHAEINAIRKASKKLKRFDLSDCVLYSSCEPCPMCFSAIHWAKIKKVVYACTRDDAKKIGFDDEKIYNIINGKTKNDIKMVQKNRKQAWEIMKKWNGNKY